MNGWVYIVFVLNKKLSRWNIRIIIYCRGFNLVVLLRGKIIRGYGVIFLNVLECKVYVFYRVDILFFVKM